MLSENCSDREIAPLCKGCDAVSSPVGERLDGHGWLAAPRGNKTAPVTQEEIGDIVCTMVGIDNRRFRVVAHAAGSQEMHEKLRFLDGLVPSLARTGSLVDFQGAGHQKGSILQIVGVVGVSDAQSGQAPGVLEVGIKRKRVALHGEGSPVRGDAHSARKIFTQKGLIGAAPCRSITREAAEAEADRRDCKARVKTPAATVTVLSAGLIKVVEDTRNRCALVIIERMFVDSEDFEETVRHQVLADQARGIGEAIGEKL